MKVVYNLLYYQVVMQISCGLTAAERAKACEGASIGHINSLNAAFALINESLGTSDLYMDDDHSDATQEHHVNMIALEQQVNVVCKHSICVLLCLSTLSISFINKFSLALI